jgi:hypothetical protein
LGSRKPLRPPAPRLSFLAARSCGRLVALLANPFGHPSVNRVGVENGEIRTQPYRRRKFAGPDQLVEMGVRKAQPSAVARLSAVLSTAEVADPIETFTHHWPPRKCFTKDSSALH